ncbi:nuclear transport factor 2 family protein [Limibaculum sp. FT325]|uniref:YybH family protein n=1 Tax=Thermohalobaculum sediminis TaxID=2939436 RepID=UPI0020BF68C4|nr:DUF4440 domain-containing protein [Limibaculum sediminis]MCL5776037.1 nuclear transport factor 2 family protein [Limibaculum sediminis]
MAFQPALKALIAQYLDAYAARDARAASAVFAERARIITPFGPPIVGRDAIAAAHYDWFDDGETNKRLDVVEAGARGEMGYAVLRWSADLREPDGRIVRDTGLSLNVLMHSYGGWMIAQTALVPDASTLAGVPPLELAEAGTPV